MRCFLSAFQARLFFFSSAAFLGCALGVCAQAESNNDKNRSVSVSSGYFSSVKNRKISNSTRSAAYFSKELEDFHTYAFDSGAETAWGQRNRSVLSGLYWGPFIANFFWKNSAVLAWMPPVLFSRTPAITTHLFGYLSRLKAFGALDPLKQFLKSYKAPSHFFSTVSRSFSARSFPENTRSIFDAYADEASPPPLPDNLSEFLLSLSQGKKTYNTHSLSATQARHTLRNLTNKGLNAGIILLSSGLNNEMRLAGEFSENVHKNQSGNQGHMLDIFPYLRLKTGALSFPKNIGGIGGDLTHLFAAYQEKGISLKRGTVNTGNWISLLLSASTWAYGLSWYDYLCNDGSSKAQGLYWHSIQAPDIENYLVTKGMTYKVKSGYQFSDTLFFPIGIEAVTTGFTGAEITLGAEKTFETWGNIHLGGHISFGQALGGDLHVRAPFLNRFFIEARTEYMSPKSFYGQRNIPVFKGQKSAVAFLLRGGMMY